MITRPNPRGQLSITRITPTGRYAEVTITSGSERQAALKRAADLEETQGHGYERGVWDALDANNAAAYDVAVLS